MRIDFEQTFALPVEEVFSYFATPADWARLYGLADRVRDLGDGWFAVPLKSFPFPLVAKNTVVDAPHLVRWEFRGFWRGHGEVRFSGSPETASLAGFEEISLRWLGPFSSIVEKLGFERRFHAIWALGWRRLRKAEQAGQARDPVSPTPAGS